MGIEPPLPPSTHEILSSPCPFWRGKRVQETHLLVLIPRTVNGKPLTLKSLGELVQAPKQGNATQYREFYIGDYIDAPAPASHWVLITRDILEGSRNKGYDDQQARVARHAQRSGIPYQVPNILDATISIFMEYVRSGNCLYHDDPWTFTRCQGKYDRHGPLVVGGCSPAGLFVSYSDDNGDCDDVGVGCSWTF